MTINIWRLINCLELIMCGYNLHSHDMSQYYSVSCQHKLDLIFTLLMNMIYYNQDLPFIIKIETVWIRLKVLIIYIFSNKKKKKLSIYKQIFYSISICLSESVMQVGSSIYCIGFCLGNSLCNIYGLPLCF